MIKVTDKAIRLPRLCNITANIRSGNWAGTLVEFILPDNDTQSLRDTSAGGPNRIDAKMLILGHLLDVTLNVFATVEQGKGLTSIMVRALDAAHKPLLLSNIRYTIASEIRQSLLDDSVVDDDLLEKMVGGPYTVDDEYYFTVDNRYNVGVRRLGELRRNTVHIGHLSLLPGCTPESELIADPLRKPVIGSFHDSRGHQWLILNYDEGYHSSHDADTVSEMNSQLGGVATMLLGLRQYAPGIEESKEEEGALLLDGLVGGPMGDPKRDRMFIIDKTYNVFAGTKDKHPDSFVHLGLLVATLYEDAGETSEREVIGSFQDSNGDHYYLSLDWSKDFLETTTNEDKAKWFRALDALVALVLEGVKARR